MGAILPVSDVPEINLAETFHFDPAAGGFQINLPRLYCETIEAPIIKPVLQYCVARGSPRREELFGLLVEVEQLMDDFLNGPTVLKADPETLKRMELSCRTKAQALLRADLLHRWNAWETDRAWSLYS